MRNRKLRVVPSRWLPLWPWLNLYIIRLNQPPLSNAQVEDVVIVEDLTKWQELVNERDALQWKLDHANVRFYWLFVCLFCFVFFLSVYFIIIKNP